MKTITIDCTVKDGFDFILSILAEDVVPDFIQVIKQPRGLIIQTTDPVVARRLRERLADPLAADGRIMAVDGVTTPHWKKRFARA